MSWVYARVVAPISLEPEPVFSVSKQPDLAKRLVEAMTGQREPESGEWYDAAIQYQAAIEAKADAEKAIANSPENQLQRAILELSGRT
jgi:hypothetical protein